MYVKGILEVNVVCTMYIPRSMCTYMYVYIVYVYIVYVYIVYGCHLILGFNSAS